MGSDGITKTGIRNWKANIVRMKDENLPIYQEWKRQNERK